MKARFARVAPRLFREGHASSELEDLRECLVRAEESVWGRVARELHDDVSQRLVALALEAHFLERAVASGDSMVRPLFESLGSELDAIAIDIHDLSRQLHPSVVDSVGLTSALEAECRRRDRSGRMAVLLEVDLLEGDPGGDPGLTVLRIAQEAIANAFSHSGATRLDVGLADGEGDLRLRIRDNGCGIQASRRRARGHPGEGVGMTSMRERARLAGGDLEVESQPGEGTCIKVRVPRG